MRSRLETAVEDGTTDRASFFVGGGGGIVISPVGTYGQKNEFRHGLFTRAVLEALRDGKADRSDGAVYVSAPEMEGG
jgi:hypothetical protein